MSILFILIAVALLTVLVRWLIDRFWLQPKRKKRIAANITNEVKSLKDYRFKYRNIKDD